MALNKDWKISGYGQIFLTLLTCQGIFLLVGCGLVVSDDERYDDIMYCVLAGFVTLATLYFGYDAIWHESEFQLVAAILSSLIIAVYLTFEWMKPAFHSKMFDQLIQPMAIVSIVCSVLYIPLCYKVKKKFGWYFFKRLGTSAQLQNIWRTFQFVSSLAKIDLEIQIVSIVLVYAYITEKRILDSALNGIYLVFVYPHFWYGRQSLKSEDMDGVQTYLYLCVLFPIYICVQIALCFVNNQSTSQIMMFFICGVSGLVCRGFLVQKTLTMAEYFGGGLKEKRLGISKSDSSNTLASRISESQKDEEKKKKAPESPAKAAPTYSWVRETFVDDLDHRRASQLQTSLQPLGDNSNKENVTDLSNVI